MNRIARQYFGMLWLALALLLRGLFGLSPFLFDVIWFEGLFPAIREVQTTVFSYLPLPGYGAGVILLLAWLIWRLPIRKSNRVSWKVFLRRLANLLGGIGASFLMLWGYNYQDRGMAARLGIERSEKVEKVAEAYLETMDRAMVHRAAIAAIDSYPSVEEVPLTLSDRDIENLVRDVLAPLGYPVKAGVNIRYLRPEGLLRRMSIAGIYNPWTGEANVDHIYGPLPRIFTAAHEMAHAFGVTSEAEANFTAYLACLSANDPLARYAAEYALWRTLAGEVNRSYPPEIRESLATAIPEDLRTDRAAIWRNAMRYKGYFPELSEALNDTYLKVQGVEAGVDDYNAFAALYFSWRRENAEIKR
ncbi:MAG: DUF3810 family protein [Cryomorphaceae bacterium]